MKATEVIEYLKRQIIDGVITIEVHQDTNSWQHIDVNAKESNNRQVITSIINGDDVARQLANFATALHPELVYYR